MSQFNLPPIAPKKAAVILGVLAVIIIVLYGLNSMQSARQSVLGLSLGGDSYGVATMGIVPAYDSAAGNYGKGMMYRDEVGSTIAPMPPVPGDGGAPAGNAEIIKTASLTLLVDDVDVAATGIEAVRTTYGGQHGNASFNDYTSSRTGNVTIWVPSERFDDALAAIKKLALQVKNENVSVSDVSAQFVDLEARLKVQRATETQYVELLKRSGKISEVLEVSRELANTRTQIEQLEGQMNYLSRQVALSSISVSLIQEVSPGEVKNEWRPLTVVKTAAKNTLSDLTNLIDMILVLAVSLPVFLLRLGFFGLLAWGIWRVGRFALAKVRNTNLP